MAAERLLLDLRLAARPAGCLPSGLDGRQEQPDEHADDRDHNQQLNQDEAQAAGATPARHWSKFGCIHGSISL